MKLFKNFKLNDKTKKLNKIDWILVGIMVLIYGIISFFKLGDMNVPSTYKNYENVGDYSIITLKEASLINKIRYYVGKDLGNITIYYSLDDENYTEATTINIGTVFTWQDSFVNMYAKYIKIVANNTTTSIGDIALFNEDIVLPIANSSDSELIDEIDLVPNEISYMNSTYFDEIYYARSAYEYANGQDAYEWSHPPLGKLLITIPVAIFGYSPFTYRLMGNLFGILLIPIMYILAKKLFKNRKWAILAGLIMMFDTFHFAHTRIALVDGFQVTFILLSVLFMKNYIDLNKKDEFKKKAINLLLSGLFFGCAMATKWNAAYFGIGLAITFFIHLLKQYNVTIKKIIKGITVNRIIKFASIMAIIPFVLYYLVFLIGSKSTAITFLKIYYLIVAFCVLLAFIIFMIKDKELLKLFGICVLSFVVIPVVIYASSYLLFPNLSYYNGTVGGIIDINQMMYNYHSTLDATHPFSSVWYEWPVMINPVWFFSGTTQEGVRMTITDIGNPAIWWVGIIGVCYLLINSIKDKDKNSIFLLIFILSTFIPYVFIGRLMFMYHYFITLPFVMLGIVAFIKWITEKLKNDRVYYGYIVLIIIMFIIFYPIVSGMPVGDDYIKALRWLPKWYF